MIKRKEDQVFGSGHWQASTLLHNLWREIVDDLWFLAGRLAHVHVMTSGYRIPDSIDLACHLRMNIACITNRGAGTSTASAMQHDMLRLWHRPSWGMEAAGCAE
jgi:hypothetical protein